MTSSINTSGLNVNYPIPGVNNNSQGFRDNFATIKTNLDTASTEITDLQNNVVVKQALLNGTVNNDMGNTLISNASTRSFRATTYNIGNALSGTVLVNVSLGDVQYGTVVGNTVIQFGGWAPSGTQSNVQLVLTFSNTSAYVSFPIEVVNTGSFGSTTLENYNTAGATNVTVNVPYGVNVLDYRFSTLDCGNTITVEPFNRPRQTTQIHKRFTPTKGYLGDSVGTTAVTSDVSASSCTCTATTITTNIITCESTSDFYLDMPVVFTGTTFGGIKAGVTYYVATIPSSTTFTISNVPGTISGPSTLVSLTTATGSMTVYPIKYLNISTENYNAESVVKTATVTTAETSVQSVTSTSASGNVITITDTTALVTGYPITFSGSTATTTATETGANAAIISGNVAIMNSSSISGTTLTVGSVSSGTIVANMILTGTGVTAGTYIVSGAGLSWTISPSQTVASTQITGTTGIRGTTLTVGSVSSGTITSGMWVNGTGVTAGTYITGGSGLSWTVNNSQNVGLATANLTTSKVTVADTSLFTVGMPITVSGITIGGLSGSYFVRSIEDAGAPGNITLSSTYGGSNVQVDYGTGSMTITYGGVYGGLSSTATYYVKQILSSTTFTIANTVGGSTTAITSGTGPASGAAAMNATAINDYTITVNNINDLAVNTPVVFSGSVIGGLAANTPYYIGSIDSGANKITISQTISNDKAGQKYAVSSATTTTAMSVTNYYTGDNIWKSVPLRPIVDSANLSGTSLTLTGSANVGNLYSSGAILSSGSNGIGYTTGAGSTVTQTTSRTNSVTIDAITGSITLVSAAGSASYATFTVNNSKVAATDVIIVNQKSGTDKYEAWVSNVQAGSFNITFQDTSGTTTEQPVFNFAVIKGVTS